MAAAAILDFQKFEILMVDPLLGSNKIGETVADIWRFNAFFKMAAAGHLGLLGAY